MGHHYFKDAAQQRNQKYRHYSQDAQFLILQRNTAGESSNEESTRIELATFMVNLLKLRTDKGKMISKGSSYQNRTLMGAKVF